MLHQTSICFVCLGNICRSPTAEAIMLQLLKQHKITSIIVDSAGTSAFHVGEEADARSRKAGEARGYQFVSRARQFTAQDLKRFDYIVAMDTQNLRNIRALCTDQNERDKTYLLRDFDPRSPSNASVPDPYYGGSRGFEEVIDICLRGCNGLLQTIQKQL